MKKLLPLLLSSALLAFPANYKPLPQVDMRSIPDTLVVQHENIILAGVGIGILIGVAGWAGVKALNKALDLWEHQLTNSVPQLRWDFNPVDDEYPE